MKRGNGEGTIYFDQRKNRWIAKVTVGYNAEGRAVRKSRTAKTKEEAIKKKAELLETHWTTAALDAARLTVAEYLTLWLDTCKVGQVRETTLVQYRCYICKLAARSEDHRANRRAAPFGAHTDARPGAFEKRLG